MSLRNSRLGLLYTRLMERAFSPLIKQFGLKPNPLSLAGFAAALTVPLGFTIHPWAGGCMILVSGILDSLDGMASRLTGDPTRFGAFWDSTLDRGSDCAYLAGFWLLFRSRPAEELLWGTILVFAALTATFLISYTKARIEGLEGICEGGFMGRAARIIYLLVWAFCLGLGTLDTAWVLWAGLALYTVLVGATVVQRIYVALETLKQ